jgi:hypothetical protein
VAVTWTQLVGITIFDIGIRKHRCVREISHLPLNFKKNRSITVVKPLVVVVIIAEEFECGPIGNFIGELVRIACSAIPALYHV